MRASKAISGPAKEAFRGDKQQFIDDLEQALYASKIISYTQGFMLMRETAKEVSCTWSDSREDGADLYFHSPARVEFELRRHCSHVARWLHH